MLFLRSLVAWANVPFTIALGVVATYVLLQVSGVLGLVAGDGDGDADGDVDHDADVDGDADADGDADDAHGGGSGGGLLTLVGVGKVPLSIVWQTFFTAFGLAGITANTAYLGATGSLPAHALVWAVPAALLVATAATGATARGVARVLGDNTNAAISRAGMVGMTGVVVSSKVGPEFGEVRVVDRNGRTMHVMCRVRVEDAAIPEKSEVVVTEYDASLDRLYVSPLDAAPAPRRRRGAGA